MDVKVGPSPQWMRQRLMAMGMRSINNVVDVSNLVMLELNRPVHFFDYDKLIGNGLWIRKARPGEKMCIRDRLGEDARRRMDILFAAGGKLIPDIGIDDAFAGNEP